MPLFLIQDEGFTDVKPHVRLNAAVLFAYFLDCYEFDEAYENLNDGYVKRSRSVISADIGMNARQIDSAIQILCELDLLSMSNGSGVDRTKGYKPNAERFENLCSLHGVNPNRHYRLFKKIAQEEGLLESLYFGYLLDRYAYFLKSNKIREFGDFYIAQSQAFKTLGLTSKVERRLRRSLCASGHLNQSLKRNPHSHLNVLYVDFPRLLELTLYPKVRNDAKGVSPLMQKGVSQMRKKVDNVDNLISKNLEERNTSFGSVSSKERVQQGNPAFSGVPQFQSTIPFQSSVVLNDTDELYSFVNRLFSELDDFDQEQILDTIERAVFWLQENDSNSLKRKKDQAKFLKSWVKNDIKQGHIEQTSHGELTSMELGARVNGLVSYYRDLFSDRLDLNGFPLTHRRLEQENHLLELANLN